MKKTSWNSGIKHAFLIVGYYTEKTPYEREASVLRLSLESLGYSYEMYGIPNQGSWQKNTQFKAQFLSTMLKEHPGQPLLYLDVDSVMIQHPVLLENIQGDIAAVHFAGGGELLSGTVYFANTPVCQEVVDKWIELNSLYPRRLPNGRAAWDQRTLRMAISEKKECRFVELPQEYTFIIELTQKRYPGLAPVIMHTRGAYRFKRVINKGRRG